MSDDTKGILVVDDSKMMRRLVVNMLHDFGYSVVFEADNISSARSVLQTMGVMLILSDWHMPGGTGLDLLHFVRETPKCSAIPFLMVTTENQRDSILEAAKTGVTSFMCKPVDKETLFEKLSALSTKFGFPAPSKSDHHLPGKPIPQVAVDAINPLADKVDLKLGFRISNHDAIISLNADHPLATELKKIYPQARFIKATDENVDSMYSISIHKWEDEIKRLGEQKKEPA